MDKEMIEAAINKAILEESKLDDAALSVGGFTSVKIRHLLNNLGSISTAYFEVGSHIGGTYISTCYKNELQLPGGYFACDSFCEFNDNGETKKRFIENCEKHLRNYSLMEVDCWSIKKLHEVPTVDLYLYDGGHDYVSQKKAVTHFAPMMADEFIMLVDDASWESVRTGTYDGLQESGVEVLYQQLLWNGVPGDNEWWWNGLQVLLLKNKVCLSR
jgi:hypothetical protein